MTSSTTSPLPGATTSRDQVAERIAAIFAEVLGQPACTTRDQFFRLGGDSLGGMQMLTRLHEEFSVRIPVADLYRYNTPEALADRLVELRSRTDTWRRSLAGTARRRRGDLMPLAVTQEGLYAIERVTRGAGFFNSVLLIRFTGDVDTEALTGAIGDVAVRQSQLRVVFGEQDGRPGQRITDQPPEIKRLDLRGRGERALHRLTQMEYLRGFDLTERPAVRFTLAQISDSSWALVVAVHHIVFDAMSQGVLVDELAHAYRCRLGLGTARQPLRLDYLDFAEWQQDRLRGDRLRGHLDALRDSLREPAAPIAPGQSTGRFTARIDDIRLPAATVRGLERTAADHNSTVFLVLLAAVADFARRRTGRSRQVITVQTANRGLPGSDEIIGCFSNMLCIGIDLPLTAGVEESIPHVQAALAAALEHEEMPFDHALDLLERDGWDGVERGHMPQLGFTLQQGSDDRIELPGCTMAAQAILQEAENFDPTSFPLVVELGAGGDTIEGKTHHLVDMWPGDTFAAVRTELLSAFDRYGGFGASASRPGI
jgi:acyl carrier protein